jgi:pimeloyl-ACP methyl ester carboxylesterase
MIASLLFNCPTSQACCKDTHLDSIGYYYRAAEPYFDLSAAYKGAKITQPSFFIWGKADGLRELYPMTIDQMRAGLPGLVGGLELDNVGHWVQHEASDLVNDQLVKFLRITSPA